jgi:hypothetical protein
MPGFPKGGRTPLVDRGRGNEPPENMSLQGGRRLPDPGGCLHGFGINGFRFPGSDGDDLFEKAAQILFSGFGLWFHDVFFQ